MNHMKNELQNSELNEVFALFESSSFYSKWENTWFMGKIMSDVFHPINLKGMEYEDVHQLSTSYMRDLLELFAKEKKFEDADTFQKMLKAGYIDPDGNAVRYREDVKCTADGLLSINRIFGKCGMNGKMVEEYETYRKMPIFFFPSERGGINTTRARVFGDRIDHTLYDLKRFLEASTDEERADCKLISAYRREKTAKWLKSFTSFEELVRWYGVEGIFVNENLEVYDIEKGQDEIIRQYRNEYLWEWSDAYYNYLKKYIEQFMKRQS